jgi:hypothetical protein
MSSTLATVPFVPTGGVKGSSILRSSILVPTLLLSEKALLHQKKNGDAGQHMSGKSLFLRQCRTLWPCQQIMPEIFS